jgi:hypothetical protein
MAMFTSGMSKVVSLSALVLVGWLSGCAIPATIENPPSGERLIGKSRQDLLACAGNPLHVIPVSDGTVFRYYKEAPMLEESFVGSKGSKAGIHGGCWAHVLLSEDRIAGVEYRPVPETLKATDQCEEIFRSCIP